MTEQEITEKIKEKNIEYRGLATKLNSLRNEINDLYTKREEVMMQDFFDYAELGTTIQIGKRCWLSGNPNGEYLKKLKEKNRREKGGLSGFSLPEGDVIEIIKINKKSINIKIKKGEVNPTYRIDRVLLCKSLMRDEEFKKRVETTAKRKSILDEILN